jgi:hypothetical protein
MQQANNLTVKDAIEFVIAEQLAVQMLSTYSKYSQLAPTSAVNTPSVMRCFPTTVTVFKSF